MDSFVHYQIFSDLRNVGRKTANQHAKQCFRYFLKSKNISLKRLNLFIYYEQMKRYIHQKLKHCPHILLLSPRESAFEILPSQAASHDFCSFDISGQS